MAIGAMILACGQPAVNTVANSTVNTAASSYEDSPTGAYMKLYAAVKSKDAEGIKALMTRKSLQFAEMAAGQQHKTADEILQNGFTASTFSPTLPQIRDQRINGNMGAVEVYDAKDSRWDDLPFIREDGQWKLAIGEMFAGTFQSPGEPESQKEREASNAASNTKVPMNTNVNMNAIKPIIPKPAANMLNGNFSRPSPNK